MSFAPHSTRSVRDGRHNRYESYTEPHVYDRVEYWQRKRDRWQAEKDTGREARDAFASGGLFAGFGQRPSPRPAASQQPQQPQQQQQPTASGRRSLGLREQASGAYIDERAAAHIERTSLRPPPMFPAINGYRPSQHQPTAYSASSSNYPSSLPSSLSPPAGVSYMSGVHELHGGPSPSEQTAKREAQRVYQATLQQQMREKEERKKREKIETEERERREEEEARNYNPFGRGGGGAPMRDSSGHVVANRTQALAQSLSPTHNSNQRSRPAAASSALQQQPQPVYGATQQPQQQYSAAAGGFAQPVGRGARVGLRSDDSDAAARQQADKQQWQHSLALQIQEKANNKKREEEARREEDRREEERLSKERSRLDEEWRRETDKEQQKQRLAQEELDSKARKGRMEEGLTDYEREQAMKGRKVNQVHTTQPEQPHQQHREEERKETVTLSAAHYTAAAGPSTAYTASHAPSHSAVQSLSYAELEQDMERLRADLRHESDAARERRASKQKQQQLERSGEWREGGRTRRRQRMAALDEDDDDTHIARFLNRHNNQWRPQSEQSPRWQKPQADSWDALAVANEVPVAGSGGQLVGESTFVPLPADYSSRVGTPELKPQLSRKQTRQQQLYPATDYTSSPRVAVRPPPPPPPAKPAQAADERPLPALAKQQQIAQVEQPLAAALDEQLGTDAAHSADKEEEMYADEEFVVEEAPLDDEHSQLDEQYEGVDEEPLATGTEQQAVEDEAAEADEQYELHQPSEYSKVVSDVDLKDDELEEFVTSSDKHETAAARKKNGRKKWSAAAAGEAAA